MFQGMVDDNHHVIKEKEEEEALPIVPSSGHDDACPLHQPTTSAAMLE